MKPYYQDGSVTIFHGDCREILPTLEPVDLVLTDPPYGVSQSGVVHHRMRGKGTRNFDFFGGDDFKTSLALVMEVLPLTDALLKPHGSGYAWLGHRQFAHVTIEREAAGWTTRFLVWAKEIVAPAPPGVGYPSGAELCLFWYRAGKRWMYGGGPDAPRNNVLGADSYRFGQPGKNGHPTQKPFGCITPLLLASSATGDIVLDPFCGSGTSLVAAKLHQRNAIGIEIDEAYCEIAAKRMSQKVLPFGATGD